MLARSSPRQCGLRRCCLIAACSNSDPLGNEIRSLKSIVVGSGDFPESQIIAEIYAQALQANGFDVGRRLGIGSRETYIPALKDHSIDLVPEYIGNLLQYFVPKSTATMLERRRVGALPAIARRPLDSDAVAGLRHRHRHRHRCEPPRQWNLKTIADLAAHSSDVKFGAPSDFQSRPSGLPGLQAEVRAHHQSR